jgi:hypothetical protein
MAQSDMGREETALERATCHVVAARQAVERQCQRIAGLKRLGVSTFEAEETPQRFEERLEIFERHEQALQASADRRNHRLAGP